MKVLAGDVGGTKTRVAVFEVTAGGLHSLGERSYRSAAYEGLGEILHEFLQGQGECERACFGIAGPVKHGKVKTTNLPWRVDARRLESELGIQRVDLLNDLEATAWGIGALGGSDYCVLNAGHPDSRGNRSVIAAGTGLGEAGMFWDGELYRPFASEGGHSDFSPRRALEVELFNFLAGRFGHVSWERVLSGPGLVNLYEFLRFHRRAVTPSWLESEMVEGDSAAAIANAALSGQDGICEETLELFVDLYGAEAGNHALKIMATGGVFIGGGIAPKILNKLKEPTFMTAFRDKGRMAQLMGGMPVRVILNDRAALYGPAVYAGAARR